jgi:hypothetical protein
MDVGLGRAHALQRHCLSCRRLHCGQVRGAGNTDRERTEDMLLGASARRHPRSLPIIGGWTRSGSLENYVGILRSAVQARCADIRVARGEFVYSGDHRTQHTKETGYVPFLLTPHVKLLRPKPESIH